MRKASSDHRADATSFAAGNRSSLAISDACNVFGTASCAASPAGDRPDSSTARVSSSMNNDTPSVRVTMRSISSAGIARAAISAVVIAVSRRSNRLKVSELTPARPIHGAWNSGRNVITSSIGGPARVQ
jgi:hypothetical protein